MDVEKTGAPTFTKHESLTSSFSARVLIAFFALL